jgi:hypothetical protein
MEDLVADAVAAAEKEDADISLWDALGKAGDGRNDPVVRFQLNRDRAREALERRILLGAP